MGSILRIVPPASILRSRLLRRKGALASHGWWCSRATKKRNIETALFVFIICGAESENSYRALIGAYLLLEGL